MAEFMESDSALAVAESRSNSELIPAGTSESVSDSVPSFFDSLFSTKKKLQVLIVLGLNRIETTGGCDCWSAVHDVIFA